MEMAVEIQEAHAVGYLPADWTPRSCNPVTVSQNAWVFAPGAATPYSSSWPRCSCACADLDSLDCARLPRHPRHPPHRRRRRLGRARQGVAGGAPNAVPDAPLADRLDHSGGVVLPIVAGLTAVVCARRTEVAHRRVHHLRPRSRVGVVPDHHARHPPAPPAGGASENCRSTPAIRRATRPLPSPCTAGSRSC